MTRFNKEYVGIFDLTVSLAITTLLKGMKDEHFKWSFLKNRPKTITELRLQVEKYVNSGEVFQAMDDLNLSDFGVVGEARVDLTL